MSKTTKYKEDASVTYTLERVGLDVERLTIKVSESSGDIESEVSFLLTSEEKRRFIKFLL